MRKCEFCEEFEGKTFSRFRQRYRGAASTRVLAQTENFVAIPTLGQIFTGSLLVLPTAHVETCTRLDDHARAEMLGLVRWMINRTAEFGHPVFFEHGATADSGGSCGIYHAHLHIVPLPEPVSAATLFREHVARADGLDPAWRHLGAADQYLLLGDQEETLFLEIGADAHRFPSQFFRRRLVEYFELDCPWDWRAYDDVEPKLIRTLMGSIHHAE